MTTRYYWSNPDGSGNNEFTERVRHYTLDVTSAAEEGSIAQSTIRVDDGAGDFDITGIRVVRIIEDEAPVGSRVLYYGCVAQRRIQRDTYRTLDERWWEVDLVDLNTFLDRRVMVGADAKRSVETDVARVHWYMATWESFPLTDESLIAATPTVSMSENNYHGQMARSALDDCAQQSAKNFFVWHNEPDGTLGLFYDLSGSDAYPSGIRLTNIRSDHASDPDDTYLINLDASLSRDPGRVYSGVYIPYQNGWVYKKRAATKAEFADRDIIMDGSNIKTASAATARANRYLNTLFTEEDVITCSFNVPRAEVNRLMQGMTVEVRMSHFPGYADDYVMLRCVEKKTFAESETHYRITVKLVGPTPAYTPGSGTAAGVIYQVAGPYGGALYFGGTGDTPPPGYPIVVTASGLTPVTDPSPPNVSWPYIGWDVTETGTVDLKLVTSVAGVLIDNIAYTITAAITLNGVVVGSESIIRSGFLQYIGDSLPDVIVTGLAVAPGDEIRATFTCSPPTMPFFRATAGTGQVGEGIYVTGGSLA